MQTNENKKKTIKTSLHTEKSRTFCEKEKERDRVGECTPFYKSKTDQIQSRTCSRSLFTSPKYIHTNSLTHGNNNNKPIQLQPNRKTRKNPSSYLIGKLNGFRVRSPIQTSVEQLETARAIIIQYT